MTRAIDDAIRHKMMTLFLTQWHQRSMAICGLVRSTVALCRQFWPPFDRNHSFNLAVRYQPSKCNLETLICYLGSQHKLQAFTQTQWWYLTGCHHGNYYNVAARRSIIVVVVVIGFDRERVPSMRTPPELSSFSIVFLRVEMCVRVLTVFVVHNSKRL